MATTTPITTSDVSHLTREEVAQRATELYEQSIREAVDTDANLGKIVVIDVGTGDFAVDELGFDAAQTLRRRNPNARLFALRVGYNVAASFGGLMERVAS